MARFRAFALGTATVLSLQACASSGATPAAAGGPSAGADLAELEALYNARQDSARLDFTPADVSFMQGMIGHHAQALVMSGLAPERAGSEEMRILAARTISSQEDEIGSMRTWLAERGQAVPEIEIDGVDLVIHGGGHDRASMPGMLSAEQMRELEAARGPGFDRLFLTYMIQHHLGAVAMVHELFATDGAALDDAVFAIASNIQVDQTSEIRRMESMLESMPDGL